MLIGEGAWVRGSTTKLLLQGCCNCQNDVRMLRQKLKVEQLEENHPWCGLPATRRGTAGRFKRKHSHDHTKDDEKKDRFCVSFRWLDLVQRHHEPERERFIGAVSGLEDAA
jgi:hypothetical protein